MEAAAAQIESLFIKAEDDLDYISRKLEAEFSMRYTKQGLDAVSRHLAALVMLYFQHLLISCCTRS